MPSSKPPPEPKKLRDGFIDALGGVNDNIDPFLLAPNQLARAGNITLRGGFPRTRPGFIKRELLFHDTAIAAWWAAQVFQGAATYESSQGDNFKLVSVGGRIFKEEPSNGYLVTEITPTQQTTISIAQVSPGIGQVNQWTVTDANGIQVGLPVRIVDGRYLVTAKTNNILTLTNIDATPGLAVPVGTPVIWLDTNPSQQPVVWFEQAEEFMVIQDGISKPVIFDGSTARRAGPKEVLVGTVMQYHNNRLWVAVNGNEWIAGDIAEINNTANLLKFTEYLVITGGGAFRVKGEILATVEMPALDASLGQGPLMVITKDSFVSFNLPPQRDQWGTITSPIQTISLIDSGALGQYGVVVINGDVWYRSKNGLRSFITARRDFTGPGNTPMSAEVSQILNFETQSLLKYSSCVFFDNRLLFTATPHRLTFGAYFDAMVALDFNAMSMIGRKSPPIYEYQWTGIHPYQLLTGEFEGYDRCYAFTRETDGIGLWEISKDGDFDGDCGRIESFVEYPALKFGTPMYRKKLQSCKAFVADLVGNVDFTLRFRNDDAACWIEWSKRNKCAKQRQCADNGTGTCNPLQSFAAGYKPHMGFGLPPETCDEFAAVNPRFGYSWQFRLEWVGHAEIKRILATADEFTEQVLGEENDDFDQI